MKNFLRDILPRLLPADYQLDKNCFIHPHEGKSDLQKSIPRKLRAYPRYGYPIKVLIIHDQDSNDCVALKKELEALCGPAVAIPILVRIACRELENWYLGDLDAVSAIYPKVKVKNLRSKAKYRNPDRIAGAQKMERLTSDFNKSHASREMGKHMDVTKNKSPSFIHFVSGLKKLIAI